VRHDALRVVCYAVNGTGVGHITRLLAIARWLRRYAAALDRRIEIWFLTSSEADGLVFEEGFAAFKIPSKTIVAETGIDRTTYLALAKQWVWHTLGLLRPDLLIVDTFPRGSFGELLGALDLCGRTAFVYRPVRAEVASRADFQAMLPLYDVVLVPESDAQVKAPPTLADRLVHVGPVLARERWELMPREMARARLGIDDAKKCVFVSAGGGGDRDAETQIEWTVQSLARDRSIAVVLGAGALYRGRPSPGVTVLTGRAAEYSRAFDAAVCAAGYNTFGELMFAGIPTAFLPQEKLADDQRARAERAARVGAGAILHEASDVLAVVRDLIASPGASDAARALVPRNGARVAAAELLRLVCPAAAVDRVEAALDDACLADLAERRGATRERDVMAIASLLCRGCEDEFTAALPHAMHLLLGHDLRDVRAFATAIVRATPLAHAVERASICADAIAALAPSEGLSAAARRTHRDRRRPMGRAGADRCRRTHSRDPRNRSVHDLSASI
jgi:UDP-N-acetylglucosamine--N-acetylmuramyl-(pentapeptide) pyrophosphoryl-undecaprenol N-acetylglucosamine transferase